jgi:dihydropteroate synthase
MIGKRKLVKYYVRPIFNNSKNNDSLKLGSSKLYFDRIELIKRKGKNISSKYLHLKEVNGLPSDIRNIVYIQIKKITQVRKKIKNLNFNKPTIMGILNVTPDSFSDGGEFLSVNEAFSHYKKLKKEGAAIVDVGGESTRPGSKTVPAKKELQRIMPVINQIKGISKNSLVSVDTRKSAVMKAVMKYNIDFINDVSGLRYDSKAISFLNNAKIPFIIMHSISNPAKMQNSIKYKDVLLDVYDFLENQIKKCKSKGISEDKIIIDPGIGFGKTLKQNLTLIKKISLLHSLGLPVMLGSSRKSFIGKIQKNELYEDRTGGSIASVLYGLSQGVQLFRVHDVYETNQAIKVYSKLI